MGHVLRRRQVVAAGLAGAGAFALGPGAWRRALAEPALPGAGPYGPPGPPNELGIGVPEGFTVRRVARAGVAVPGTGHVWHAFPDGMATFATEDGGWILVSNSEVPGLLGGGVGAIRFGADGSIESAYRILRDTDMNCAGGPTPWGTWLSCEEVDRGLVWECDPTGPGQGTPHPAMGAFKHEAACVDDEGQRVYLSEDEGSGGFYRFTPDSYPDLGSGLLEVAEVGEDRAVAWHPVPDPSASSGPTRQQVPQMTVFRRGEGIWFDSGYVYLATTSDNRVWRYSTTRETIDVIYDAELIPNAPLTGVDNVCASPSGDVFVCEDNGEDEFDVAIVTPEREVSIFLTVSGRRHRGSELAGVCFDPSGTRMYVSSQRGGDVPTPLGAGLGETYEVTGPFRLERTAPAGPPPIRVEAPERITYGTLARRGLPVRVRSDEPVSLTVAMRWTERRRRGRRILRRRRTLSRRRTRVPARGDRTFRLRPPRAERSVLRRRRRTDATVTVLAAAAGDADRRTITTHQVRIVGTHRR